MDESGHSEFDPVFLTVYGHVRRGIKSVVSVGQPAAGADWSQAVPGGEQWRVIMGSWQLVTSATVASRNARAQITDGTNVLFAAASVESITAGVTARINAQAGVISQAAGVGIWSKVVGIPMMWLPPGYVVGSITDNLQGTDQYQNIRLFVERVYETDTDLTDEYYRRMEAEREPGS